MANLDLQQRLRVSQTRINEADLRVVDNSRNAPKTTKTEDFRANFRTMESTDKGVINQTGGTAITASIVLKC